jgi:hypothetical protein
MNLIEFADKKFGKKMMMAIMGAYLVKDIADLNAQIVVSLLIAVGIAAQTVIDIRRKE